MRIIILSIALSSLMLSGCALLIGEAAVVEGGAIAADAGGVELAGGARLAAGSGAAEAAATGSRIMIASDLYEIGAERGVLSDTLDRMTAKGTRPASIFVERNTGILRGDGRIIGRLNPTNGDLLGPGEQKAGFLNANDARIYEITNNGQTRAIAELEGFVPRNGVELISQVDGTTVVRILRPNVTLDVLAIRNGMYLVRLADGTMGLLPAGLVDLSLLTIAAVAAACPNNDDGGIAVRQSGETLFYSHCEQKDHAIVLTTTDGTTVVDGDDVKAVRPTGHQASENLEQLRSHTNHRSAGIASYTAAMLMTQPRSVWINAAPFRQPHAVEERPFTVASPSMASGDERRSAEFRNQNPLEGRQGVAQRGSEMETRRENVVRQETFRGESPATFGLRQGGYQRAAESGQQQNQGTTLQPGVPVQNRFGAGFAPPPQFGAQRFQRPIAPQNFQRSAPPARQPPRANFQ